MRATAEIEIGASAAQIWEEVANPSRYLDFMSGVTRWEVVSEARTGVGARYRMLLRIGSAEVGGLIEVVESVEPTDLAWVSVTGVDQRGRWRLRERSGAGPGGPRTRVELRLAYGVAGAGISGWLAEQIAAPSVRGHLRRSLWQLKRQVEHEQLRTQAAERRRVRAGGGV